MEMTIVKCPSCGMPASKDKEDGTVYCSNANCGFMGVPPEELRST